MVDKKQIWVIFLFKFKLSHKAAETTHYSNNAFGPGTTNKHPVQWWFKKFCKADKSLEDEEHSGRPLEVDNDQLRGSLKLMHLQLHEKLPKNSMPTILGLFGIWSKLERWKSSVSGGLMSWLKVKKMVALKYYFIILHNNELFLNWTVTYNENFIQQPAMTSSVVGPRSTKHFPKSNLHPKKGHSPCLVICFWSDPPQLSESKWNHYIWEVCSANWWDAQKSATAAASIGQQEGLNSPC